MTMPLRVMPDVVKMVVGFLRAQPELTDLLADPKNVRGELPPKPTFPAVRVTRIGSEAVISYPHELDMVNVQIDCWGGNDRQAERIAAVVQALLTSTLFAQHTTPEGSVRHVTGGNYFSDLDDTMDPPRRRYVVTVDLYVRPASYPTE